MDLGPLKTPWEYGAKRALHFVNAWAMTTYALLWVAQGAPPSPWPVLALLVVVIVATGRLRRRAHRKQFAELRTMGFRVCPDCFYDLRALHDEGACPECGKAYTEATLVLDWSRFFFPPARPGLINRSTIDG